MPIRPVDHGRSNRVGCLGRLGVIPPAGSPHYRSRLRLISGGVAAFARRSPVGASDTPFSGSNSPARVISSAWQMFASVSIEGLAIPRSMAEMYVRSTSASKASVSCDLSTSCRRCLMRRPSAAVIGAGERVADSGRRAVMPGRMPVRRLINDAVNSSIVVVFTLHKIWEPPIYVMTSLHEAGSFTHSDVE